MVATVIVTHCFSASHMPRNASRIFCWDSDTTSVHWQEQIPLQGQLKRKYKMVLQKSGQIEGFEAKFLNLHFYLRLMVLILDGNTDVAHE